MQPTHRDTGFPFFPLLANCFPFFPLLADFKPRVMPTTEYAQRAHDRRVMASAGRWVSLVVTVGILLWLVLVSHGLLAPLLILVWLFIVNRLVWSTGADPSPRLALAHSHLVWWTLSLALAAVWCHLAGLLFPAPFWEGTAMVLAVIAAVAAIGGAFPTAKAVRAGQEPAPFDDGPYRLVAGVMKMTPAAYERGIADGSFTVEKDALGRLVARIPAGSDALLEDRAALEERVRVKAPAWMVAHADPVDDILVLEEADDETVSSRDAVARSGGLFAEHLGGGLDLPVIDLSLGDQPLPRL